MALAEYRRKRQFNRTAEPKGSARGSRTSRKDALRFVVQLHHASHRHYDFRLELNGVLKSWAVPKGPSFDPAVKRMAVEVEDHPLDYAGFEGTIPHDQYGGGHVAVFDSGTWVPVDGDAAAQFKKGHLKFELHGQRLHGLWHLVRTRKAGSKPQWLLFKSDDAFAGPWEADDLLEGVTPPGAVDARRARRPGRRRADSAESGATSAGAKSQAKSQRLPAGPPEPMLTRLLATPPAGPAWLHEIKWDGYRILAVIKGGAVTLWSRNGIDWTARMPAVRDALAALRLNDGVLDGEVIAGAGKREDFNALQTALKAGDDGALVYMVFDLLRYQGTDLRERALVERKAMLKQLLHSKSARVGVSPVAKSPADHAFKLAVAAGYEGIISKRKASSYRAGRGDDWVKVKAVASDEFAIVGYTPPKGSRTGIGALLLATPEGRDAWRYVGRVGSGFSEEVLSALATALTGHGDKVPTVRVPAHDTDLSKARWIAPAGVVEVFVRGYGSNGLLRQATFKALRSDKLPADLRSGDAAVTLSSPGKILYPDAKITKQQVWDYYNAVMAWLLPEIAGRPVSLVRCPGGINAQCFFQKHATADMRTGGVDSAASAHGLDADTLVVDSADDVRLLVQYNTLEFHPWGAHATTPDLADLLVFDLDPDVSVAWPDVVRAARALRDNLAHAGLKSFVRTSGGKGLHVVVPLNPPVPWTVAKPFAEAFAKTMATLDPGRYTATAAKDQRTGRIFIDWLRNGRGATSVASFSLRARPGAPVAMPLAWSELGRIQGGDAFNLMNAPARVARWRAHPWGDYTALSQTLPHSD